jgi:hypothetical protein
MDITYTHKKVLTIFKFSEHSVPNTVHRVKSLHRINFDICKNKHAKIAVCDLIYYR